MGFRVVSGNEPPFVNVISYSVYGHFTGFWYYSHRSSAFDARTRLDNPDPLFTRLNASIERPLGSTQWVSAPAGSVDCVAGRGGRAKS